MGPYSVPQDPELADLLRALGRTIRMSIRTHVPGKVLAFDPAQCLATIEVGLCEVVAVKDPLNIPTRTLLLKGVPPNAEAVLMPIVLPNIPVVFPRTSQGRITFPVGTGDTGSLHVHDRALQTWRKAKGVATDPVLAFTHALSESEFFPGLHHEGNAISPPVDMAATVVDGAQVKIGAQAVSSITMAEQLIAVIDAMFLALTYGTTDGGATAFAAFKVAWELQKNTIKATKGKVE